MFVVSIPPRIVRRPPFAYYELAEVTFTLKNTKSRVGTFILANPPPLRTVVALNRVDDDWKLDFISVIVDSFTVKLRLHSVQTIHKNPPLSNA